jgi:hypothetical protein
MVHDDEREFHRIYALRTVLADMLKRYPNDMAIWGKLNARQAFSITRLAILASMLEASVHNEEYIVARAMLARAIIEINADTLAVLRSPDPEKTAELYSVSEYAFYEQLMEQVHDIRLSGKVSKTRLRKRIFKYKPTWAEISLSERIRLIDNGTDAINWYDLLSHFIHANLTHANPEFGLFGDHVNYVINYYAATTILVTVPTGIFNKKEIQELAIFTHDVTEAIMR